MIWQSDESMRNTRGPNVELNKSILEDCNKLGRILSQYLVELEIAPVQPIGRENSKLVHFPLNSPQLYLVILTITCEGVHLLHAVIDIEISVPKAHVLRSRLAGNTESPGESVHRGIVFRMTPTKCQQRDLQRQFIWGFEAEGTSATRLGRRHRLGRDWLRYHIRCFKAFYVLH